MTQIWLSQPELTVRLRELYDANLTYAEIAMEMCMSRCAVQGRVFRLGWEPRAVDISRRKGCGIRQIMLVNSLSRPSKPKPLPPPVLLPPDCAPVTLLDASRDQCRFISGDDLLVCGAPGFPWCEYHRGIVYPVHKRVAA